MELIPRSRNLICVFAQLRKSDIKVDALTEELRKLLPGENPQRIVMDQPAEAPIVVSFQRLGFQAIVVDGKLQLQSGAPKGAKASERFAELASAALRACGNQELTMYGFNVDYSFEGEPVSSIVGLKGQLSEVVGRQLAQTTVHLVYSGENQPRVLVDVGDVGDASQRTKMAHVNIHYENACRTDELAERVSDLHAEALGLAVQAVEGVIGHE